MNEKLTNYDPAEDLGNDVAIATFMSEAFARLGDPVVGDPVIGDPVVGVPVVGVPVVGVPVVGVPDGASPTRRSRLGVPD